MKQVKGQLSFGRGDGTELLTKQQKTALKKYEDVFDYKTLRIDGPRHSIVEINAYFKSGKQDSTIMVLSNGSVCFYPHVNKIEYYHYKSLGRALSARVKILKGKGILGE